MHIGKTFFKYRDYTPIPLILILLFVAKPTVVSATIGILLIILGEGLRLYSVGFIGAISRTRKDRTGGELITSGPFAYIRNPIYCGNFFISLGIASYGGVLWFVLLTFLGFIIQYGPIVKYEEHFLFETFTERYEAYCKNVPAWVPKKQVAFDALELEWPPDIKIAIKSEKRTLAAIGGILLILMIIS